MKRLLATFTVVLIPLFLTACNQDRPAIQVASVPETAAKETFPTGGPVAQGTVAETMNTGGYTYVQVDTGSEKIWAAAPECVVNVGDSIVVPAGMAMRDYHSNTLDRDFDLVYFVGSFETPTGTQLSKAAGMPGGHPPMAGASSLPHSSPPAEVDVSGLEKAEGGRTVGEICENKADLVDQKVQVRGKVVKFNRQIMGKNWLHIRDGSGDADAGTNDLTVTTDVTAKVGDTVLVTGEVHIDKDFGYGYKYDVIIEDATVVVE